MLSRYTPKIKCTKFLTSLLSPSAKRSKKKANNEYHNEGVRKGNEEPDEEPGYAVVEDLNRKTSTAALGAESIPSQHIEPLYATVKKKKCRKGSSASDIVETSRNLSLLQNPNYSGSYLSNSSISVNSERDGRQILELSYNLDAEQVPMTETEKACHNDIETTLVQDHKEEIKNLTERMKEISDENCALQKIIQDIKNEQKRKEDKIHAELRLKITQLEAETRKDVQSITERTRIVENERKLLAEQLHAIHEEKHLLQKKYAEVCDKVKVMISPERHTKDLEQLNSLLASVKQQHNDERKQLIEQNKTSLQEKDSLIISMQELKNETSLLKNKNESIENDNKMLIQKKNQLEKQIEELKLEQNEFQNLLLSVLKLAENIEAERNILLNKVTFQEYKEREIQATIIDYSLNIGKLQEHISNVGKKNSDKLVQIRSSFLQNDENMKQMYDTQLSNLRETVFSQKNKINELENEKNKLESNLESLWQTSCKGDSDLLQQLNNKLSFSNI